MSVRVNLRIAWESLADAPARNLFALGGLTLGVASVVAIFTLTMIVRREALRQFDVAGLDVIAVRKVSASNSAGRPSVIDLDLAAQVAEAVPGIRRVAPLVERKVSVQLGSATPAVLPAVGVTEAFFRIHPLPLAAGRRIGTLDERESVVILGSETAVGLGLRPEDAIGRSLLVDGRACVVVGVLQAMPAVLLPSGRIDQAVVTPASTLLRGSPQAEVGTLFVQTTGTRRPGEVGRDVIAFLQTRVADFGAQITGAEAVVDEMTRQLRLYSIFFAAIGVLALVAGGFSVMNGLLLAVAQRRVEIGLRRALGAFRRDVQAQFLYEALALGGLGGIMGTGLGVLVAVWVSRSAGWEFFLAAPALCAGGLVAVVISAGAGFLPAFQAARLDPVDAMKP